MLPVLELLYNPDNANNVFLVENGKYIEFTLIESRFKEKSLEDMQDYISSCETQVIEICTEILDSNYTRTQILSKEFYSVIYEKPVFFFRT